MTVLYFRRSHIAMFPYRSMPETHLPANRSVTEPELTCSPFAAVSIVLPCEKQSGFFVWYLPMAKASHTHGWGESERGRY